MEKTVITVVGRDNVGIIARCSAYLFEHNINVMDIAQTVTGGFFNMMMIVDVQNMDLSFETFASEMKKLGEEFCIDIRCQKEEIFDMMHRI